MKAWKMGRGCIAAMVEVGDTRFTGWQKLLGAPAARYFRPGGSEFARQWNVRRRANSRVYLKLLRMVGGSEDVVDFSVAERKAA